MKLKDLSSVTFHGIDMVNILAVAATLLLHLLDNMSLLGCLAYMSILGFSK